MAVIWIVLGVTALLAGALIVAGIHKGSQSDGDGDGVLLTGATVAVATLLLGVIVGFMHFLPKYNLWKAEIDRQIIVVEARERADAAVEEARAEVARAEGTAEANRIVADSITEPYLRYLYINSLATSGNQIIYVPTEAGLPILEAGRNK